MNKFFSIITGILFIGTIIFISSIYHFFTQPVRVLEIPTPNGTNITIKITGNDLIKILESSTKQINVNISDYDPYLDREISRLNQIISSHKDIYLFYYDKIQEIYPERYFVICVPSGCSYYYFSVAGLIRASPKEMESKIKKPLIIYFDDDELRKIINTLDNKSFSLALQLFKQDLIDGRIRVKNFKLIAERIVNKYEKH